MWRSSALERRGIPSTEIPISDITQIRPWPMSSARGVPNPTHRPYRCLQRESGCVIDLGKELGSNRQMTT
jgi:hypothetical protein